ncbi:MULTISPECIES: hypothetical protein [Cupriavidus]|uniref:Uncharacterized protein n=2 Tax=Cupriavidus metallidurans TaxID=119219 RepID=A0A482J2X7_9BURK|nr:hypothetical protein [Cupriavidus metallidurans]QBP14323.1 hypothetical protein DDF84_031810 [Cupriavidus metallidurans]
MVKKQLKEVETMDYRCAVQAVAMRVRCSAELEEVPHHVVVDRGLDLVETVRVLAVDESAAVDMVNVMNDQAYAALLRV